MRAHKGSETNMTIRCFLRDTRGGATALAAAAVTVMTVGGAALITDHLWLVDQRDTLKTATDAAAVAATLEMSRLMDTQPGISDTALETELMRVARRYVELNLQHLSQDRLIRAQSTLVVEVISHRGQRTVDVSAQADLGGTLLSRHMPLLGKVTGPPVMRVEAGVESITNAIEVVLALDISGSMTSCLEDNATRCATGDTRMSIVKAAAANLVEVLNPNADNQVAIGVVPWHATVRLDQATSERWERNGWARYPQSRHYAATYSCGYRMGPDRCNSPAEDQALPPTPPESWNGCLDEHRLDAAGTHAAWPASDTVLDPPSQRPFAQAFYPAPYGAAYECMTYPAPTQFRFQLCYGDVSDWPAESRPPKIQPAQYACEGSEPPLLPLTADRAAIDAAIDAIEPVGMLTYSALGVMWSQRLLEHRWRSVWGESAHPASNPDTRKALVLLTDGDDSYCDLGNQQKRSCSSSTVGMDRTEACALAKAAGIEIFVVAAMDPVLVSEHLGETLRACSSEADNPDGSYVFLNNSTPENLNAAFADIATQLSVVRRVY